MIRNSCSATRRTFARSVAGAPGEVTRNRIRARSSWSRPGGRRASPASRPLTEGSSSMTHDPASRWRRCTTPIRAISSAMSHRVAVAPTGRGVAASSNRLGDARAARSGRSPPSRPNRSVRDGHRQQASQPGMVQEHASPARTAPRSRGLGIWWPVSLRPAVSSSCNLLASRWAFRRASLSGESSARCPSRSQVWSSPRSVPVVVLQLHQVQPTPAEDQQVHLVPLALAVAELEVGPGTERRACGSMARMTLSPSASWVNCEGVTSIHR